MADDLIHEGITLNKYSISQHVSDDVDINIGKVEKLSVHCRCHLQEEGEMFCCEGCDLWYIQWNSS